MPIYRRVGQIPRKRHTAFHQVDGSLYSEELVGTRGFSGPSSLLYHLYRPTSILGEKRYRDMTWESDSSQALRHRHFMTHMLSPAASPILERTPVLFNSEVALSFVQPQQEDEFFYRNAQGDELIFVSDGGGVLESQMGELPFRRGDYLVIPRGVLHRYRISSGPIRFLVIESAGYLRTPARYRNDHGQLMEISPYCERDIRWPENLPVYDEKGEFRLLVKKDNGFTEVILDHHPFDVVGWDGYYYPWALNIEDFEPRVGRIRLPSPVHQTFEGDGFVICSFCPRPFDFDTQAASAPYNHSNVMADEVIYYASSEFVNLKGIEYGSLTLHPDGLPHGPQPGRGEELKGKAFANELAVKLDTCHPLRVSRQALEFEDKNYYLSWSEGDGL